MRLKDANVSEAIRRLNPELYGRPVESCPEPMKSEADLHYAIMDECCARGWIFLHGSMAERTHRTAGEPDFIILASGGRTFLVECKSATGKLSPDQQAMRAHAAKLGHTIHIVRSMEEFLKAVT
jgi:hypothetical protein